MAIRVTCINKLFTLQEPDDIYLITSAILLGFCGSRVQAGGHLSMPATVS
jgi:hypothetical protein